MPAAALRPQCQASIMLSIYDTAVLTRGELHFEAVQAGLIVETPLFQL
jgi:hypothetical protein